MNQPTPKQDRKKRLEYLLHLNRLRLQSKRFREEQQARYLKILQENERARQRLLATELDKHRRCHDEGGKTIFGFLKWLEEQDLEICRWIDAGVYDPIHKSPEQLIAQYYEIDLKKVEEERQALLDYQRQLNER